MGNFKLSGGCHCGNIRYTIDEPAVETHHCHCSVCRRVHGAIFVTLSLFPRKAFHYDKQVGLGTYDTSASVHRHFCKNCGCNVTIDLDGFPELIAIATGTIDNGANPGHPAETYRHAFVTSKVPWYDINDGVRQTEGFN